MKKVLLVVVTVTFSLSLFSQTWIQPGDAKKHKGDTVTLIGFVTNVKQVTHGEGSATLIGLKTKDPKHSLTLRVNSSDRAKFKQAPEITYLNQYAQVTGLVSTYKRNSEIILHNEDQIAIARDAAPEEE
jgi:DNA/RNA endonuclease YhcR with UshA esterase domain